MCFGCFRKRSSQVVPINKPQTAHPTPTVIVSRPINSLQTAPVTHTWHRQIQLPTSTPLLTASEPTRRNRTKQSTLPPISEQYQQPQSLDLPPSNYPTALPHTSVPIEELPLWKILNTPI
jgi:hypothetical protein